MSKAKSGGSPGGESPGGGGAGGADKGAGGAVWGRRFEGQAREDLFDRFNASIGQDMFLAEAEVNASAAYARALRRAGVLTEAEAGAIGHGLDRVRARLEAGEATDRFEDVHSAVELLLTEEIGPAGLKLHTGRSRNEQAATDERLSL
jgi:argininosuccinate lyase